MAGGVLGFVPDDSVVAWGRKLIFVVRVEMRLQFFTCSGFFFWI